VSSMKDLSSEFSRISGQKCSLKAIYRSHKLPTILTLMYALQIMLFLSDSNYKQSVAVTATMLYTKMLWDTR